MRHLSGEIYKCSQQLNLSAVLHDAVRMVYDVQFNQIEKCYTESVHINTVII